MIDLKAAGYTALIILLAVFALARVIRELLSPMPRICTRCAARTDTKQGWRIAVALASVVALSTALSANANDFNENVLFVLGLSYFIDLLGVASPVCETCRGRTLVPTTSPIGKELLSDYHHTQAEDPSPSTQARSR